MMEKDNLLAEQLTALLTGEKNEITILANTSALVMQSVTNLNWAGFYLYDKQQDELFLGPFQGQVACMHIPLGSGVCGAAGKKLEVQNVPDVTAFPGYISCDAAAKSELVIPLLRSNGQLYGVLDLDAPIKARFDKQLVKTLTEVGQIVMESIDETN